MLTQGDIDGVDTSFAHGYKALSASGYLMSSGFIFISLEISERAVFSELLSLA